MIQPISSRYPENYSSPSSVRNRRLMAIMLEGQASWWERHKVLTKLVTALSRISVEKEKLMGEQFKAEFELGVVGKPSRSNQVYSRECLDQMVQQGNQMALDGRALGQIGNPDDGKTKLSKVSHKILPKFRIENDKLVGEFEILDTEQGRILQEMIKPKQEPNVGISSKVVIRPRMYGNLIDRADGIREVDPKTLNIASFDLTLEPPESI